jgi:hypothetical protein
MSATEQLPHEASRLRARDVGFGQRLTRNWVAAGAGLAALAFSVFAHFSPTWPEPIKELFLALTAAMAVHLLDRSWLFKDTSEALDEVNDTLVSNLSKDTQKQMKILDDHIKVTLDDILLSIQQNITSLQAMSRAGVIQLYESRDAAATDIERDLVVRI